ncbi:MAG: hypothetical protein AAF735_06950 [Myxococcota bacterium]
MFRDPVEPVGALVTSKPSSSRKANLTSDERNPYWRSEVIATSPNSVFAALIAPFPKDVLQSDEPPRADLFRDALGAKALFEDLDDSQFGPGYDWRVHVKSGGQSRVITQRIESFVPRDRLELSHAAIYRLEGLVGLAGRLSGYTELHSSSRLSLRRETVNRSGTEGSVWVARTSLTANFGTTQTEVEMETRVEAASEFARVVTKLDRHTVHAPKTGRIELKTWYLDTVWSVIDPINGRAFLSTFHRRLRRAAEGGRRPKLPFLFSRLFIF